MADDQDQDGRKGLEPSNQGEEEVSYAEAGEPQTPSETRSLGDERPPSEEELDAREEHISLKRRPMGPTPPPGARAALTEPEPPMEDVSETVIPGLT